MPFGSARVVAGSRPTRRLDRGGSTSRLGAGLTRVPPVPVVDPRHALMDPPVVAEDKRFCSVCGAPVGRARDGQPGRTKGFCPKCRTPFDFEPRLAPGALVGGQYEVAGCLAHGGMGWIYLARDRNVNDRWVVLKGLLNTGDPDASRAAAAEKQYLAEVEHPLIVEIYNFVAAADGAFYIVMEYVGGRSLNNILKDRMAANRGLFSPIPVDQAIAYLVEILPAFSYLHSLGLLYCDFKPANMIQVGDGLKLIDLGGVRRVDDDTSPIYGTVGFQAPEVARDGCSVASDVYTVARTLAVLIFEFKGYQTKYLDSLPSADEVPVFAEHDSLYRWLLKGTAPRPEDRFQSAEEMRDQLLGVLRDVTSTASSTVTRSTPSQLFETPAVAGDQLSWSDLPRLITSPDDPMATYLANVTATDPSSRMVAYDRAPEQSTAVLVARAYAALELRQPGTAEAASAEVLAADPWEWRGVWMHGLAALLSNDAAAAVERVQRGLRAAARRAGAQAGARPGLRAVRRDGRGPADVRPVRPQRRGVRRPGAVRHRPPRRRVGPARRGARRARAHPGHQPGLRRRPPPARRAARRGHRRRPRPRRSGRGGGRAGRVVDGRPGAQRPAHPDPRLGARPRAPARPEPGGAHRRRPGRRAVDPPGDGAGLPGCGAAQRGRARTHPSRGQGQRDPAAQPDMTTDDVDALPVVR